MITVKGCQMRRGRTVREHRNLTLRHRVLTPARRREAIQTKLKKARQKNHARELEKIKKYISARKRKITIKTAELAASKIEIPPFKPHSDYECRLNDAKICHVIESWGLGGAQTMMLELVGGLNKYYGNNIKNTIVYLNKKQSKNIYLSYGIDFETMPIEQFKTYCTEHDVDIVVHHRIAVSRCIREFLPKKVKYVLINHTVNNLKRVLRFTECDVYVSVCDYLNNHTPWENGINKSRRVAILNGVENDYIDSLNFTFLGDGFKTGRCHRLSSDKFNVDSIYWLGKTSRLVPTLKHYLIGTSKHAKIACSKTDNCTYLGPIFDRSKKMSLIKSWDVYFYETFSHEGASVAILESLASGVPVICKPLGGNSELVHHGTNGLLVADRSEFSLWLQQLATNKKLLASLKQKTIEDFNNRLHIRHTCAKYVQLFEYLISCK